MHARTRCTRCHKRLEVGNRLHACSLFPTRLKCPIISTSTSLSGPEKADDDLIFAITSQVGISSFPVAYHSQLASILSRSGHRRQSA